MMGGSWLDQGVGAVHDVTAILCFRSLPVLGFCLLTTKIPFASKGLILLAYAIPALTMHVWSLPAIAWLAVAYGYFAVVGSAVPIVAVCLRDQRLTRAAVFAVCVSAFLWIPCFTVPAAARATVLILGWDMMLSSYSYCVEVAQANAGEKLPLGECLFFLLVNPALIYVRRGRQVSDPVLSPRAAMRCGLGLLALLVTFAFVIPACTAVRSDSSIHHSFIAKLAVLAAFGLLRFLVEYGLQAGLASLQIGWLRFLGHEIPERYRWPIVASDPLDFWRRWNTYVGGWMSRYVFWPIACRFRGHGRSWRLQAAQAVAILATFVVVGLLHDCYMYAVAFDAEMRWFQVFSVIGILVVVWLIAARAARRFVTSRLPSWVPSGALAFGSRVSFWALAAGCVAWGWS